MVEQWKLVPVEPTDDMVQQAAAYLASNLIYPAHEIREITRGALKWALAAAPVNARSELVDELRQRAEIERHGASISADGPMSVLLDRAADALVPTPHPSVELVEARRALRALADWCGAECNKLGVVDGYDYRSGEEYGLRCAQIEIERRIKTFTTLRDARSPPPSLSPRHGVGVWQDISTAPKVHGEMILAPNRYGAVDLICWNDAIGGWDDGFYDGDGYDDGRPPLNPTIWQPAPALPALTPIEGV